MAIGAMVVRVRASVRVTDYSNSVCKGGGCEDDDHVGQSGSGVVDRG